MFQPLVLLLFNEQEARTWKKVPMMLIEKQTQEEAALSGFNPVTVLGSHCGLTSVMCVKG